MEAFGRLIIAHFIEPCNENMLALGQNLFVGNAQAELPRRTTHRDL